MVHAVISHGAVALFFLRRNNPRREGHEESY
jgi:hypothetical protein